MRLFRFSLFISSPATMSKSGAKALAIMIQDGSLPVRLNQSIPAMIAIAVEYIRCSNSTGCYFMLGVDKYSDERDLVA